MLASALLSPAFCQCLPVTRFASYPEGKLKGEIPTDSFMSGSQTTSSMNPPLWIPPFFYINFLRMPHWPSMIVVYVTAVSSPKRSATEESLWYFQTLGITDTSLIDLSSNPDSPTYKISDSCYIIKSASVFSL